MTPTPVVSKTWRGLNIVYAFYIATELQLSDDFFTAYSPPPRGITFTFSP